MTTSLPSIAFLGAGSMGGAILRGVVASGIPHEGIAATNRTAEKAAELVGLEGVTSIALADRPEANRELAGTHRVIVVGVKPVMVPALLDELAPSLREDAIVVSLAAGVTLETFRAHLGEGVSVLRSMPNTPATVGRAVTGLAAGTTVAEADRAIVRDLFATVGEVIEVDETMIDPLSTISGSGPAYVFLLIEEFTRAAIAMGFDDNQARRLAEGTFIGAAELLRTSAEDPVELRRRVTSPKGTTERAIAVLEEAELADTFHRAAEAALARARELARGE